MLSMCSLVCRLVRGWKQTEATTLISQAATTPGSSLMLHDLNEPSISSLAAPAGSYIGSPYPQLDVLFEPYKCTEREAQQQSQQMHSSFCQAFGRTSDQQQPCLHSSLHYATSSLFCRRGCGEDREGDCGLLYHPPRTQVIWCDNNKKASLVSPRQVVDLTHWTLFFACVDEPTDHSIKVPIISSTLTSSTVTTTTAPLTTTTSTTYTPTITLTSTSTNNSTDTSPYDAVNLHRSTALIREDDYGSLFKDGSTNHVDHSSSHSSLNGSTTGPSVSSIRSGAGGGTYDGIGDGGEQITILMEAQYSSNGSEGKARDDDGKTPVMAEQVCRAYAWKCRGVFGVVAHTTPRRFMILVEAFFAGNLLLDLDLHVTKIITVDVVGEAGRMTEPSSLAECVTPGGFYHANGPGLGEQFQQKGWLLEAARAVSSSSIGASSAVSLAAATAAAATAADTSTPVTAEAAAGCCTLKSGLAVA